MKANRLYLIAIALLAALALVFGVAGTLAPPPAEEAKPSQSSYSSSDSVAHFANPPTYDSGWVDITSKCGQSFNFTHDLNTAEVFVDITGKQTLGGGEHQKNLGGTGYVPGWTQKYGGARSDYLNSIVHPADEYIPGLNVSREPGYVLAGYTNSYGAGSSDFWLVKTDASGNMQWNKTYGGTGDDVAYCVVPETSMPSQYYGGYAIAGYTNSYGAGGYDFWLVKTDASGNMQWSKTYGGTGDDRAYQIVQTSDGGYALAGYTNSYGAGGNDFWLVKTNWSGDVQWSKTYGGTGDDIAHSLVQTSGGGYALAGWTYSYGVGIPDRSNVWLVRTDASGNMQWDKTYGGAKDDLANSLIQTKDGGYAMAGRINGVPAGAGGFALIKTDGVGNFLWNETYDSSFLDQALALIQTSDEGYALSGTIGTIHMSWMLSIKTNSSGALQWKKAFGGWLIDYGITGASVIAAGDGGYAMVGAVYAIPGSPDPLLIKTQVESGLAWTSSTANTVTLYRGMTDTWWNYVRVRIWVIKEPTWIYGDINMDGVVDAKDLYILSRNYGKTFSLLSLSGIVAIGGIQTYKTRKKTKATDK